MKDSFTEAITFTFAAEGYRSKITGDAGGRTLWGVSSVFWPQDFARMSAMDSDQAKAYALAFYRKNFWDFIDADDLPYPLDCVAFDTAVNPGPTWCLKNLFGLPENAWQRLLDLREQHYREVAHPNVLKGLLNRCEALREKYKEEA